MFITLSSLEGRKMLVAVDSIKRVVDCQPQDGRRFTRISYGFRVPEAGSAATEVGEDVAEDFDTVLSRLEAHYA